MNLPDISIERGKCATPILCRKCLILCPTVVFSLKNEKTEKFKETSPENFSLYAKYRASCTGCMECVKVCPQGAITIAFPQ